MLVCVLLMPLASAQNLVEFENGQVADADDINSNFSALKNELYELKVTLGLLEPKAAYCLDPGGEGAVIGANERNLFSVSQQVTISGWAKTTNECDPRVCPIISAEMTNSGVDEDNTGFALWIHGEQLGGYVGTGVNTPSKYSYSYDGAVQRGRWNHLAMVRDGASVKLFINGSLDSEFVVDDGDISFDGGAWEHNTTAIGLQPYPNGLNGAVTDRFFGLLSQVAVWNRPLSDDSFKAMALNEFDYESSAPSGYWPLDDGPDGSYARDLSTASNDATLGAAFNWSNDCD